MELWREGNLINSDINTGDTLSLELFEPDALGLMAPESEGRIMNRFMGLRRLLPGWAAEDKVWIELRLPRDDDENEKVASLSLDGVGDLYYTIFDSEALKKVNRGWESRDLDGFVESDPSQKLKQIGIKAAKIFGLPLIERIRRDQESDQLYRRYYK